MSRARTLLPLLAAAAFLSSPAAGQDERAIGSPARGSTFFMGRIQYSENDGQDCSDVGQDLLKLVSRASTLKVSEERRVKLTDPQLYETPFLFMNGHDDFVLGGAELESLRTYFAHGGFVFASGCCTNPEFPKAWRRELSRVFPGEPVRRLPYDHLIYRSFYKIEKVPVIGEERNVQLEGLTYKGHLVAVMGEEGICCAFSAENSCNDGKGVATEDGQKLALNIAVYAMTH